MAHPVVVNSQAGITQDYVLYLAADSPAVTALTFVTPDLAPPAAGGGARVQLATQTAFRLYIPRCKVGPTQADRNAAATQSVFTKRLEDAAWARILTELEASGKSRCGPR